MKKEGRWRGVIKLCSILAVFQALFGDNNYYKRMKLGLNMV